MILCLDSAVLELAVKRGPKWFKPHMNQVNTIVSARLLARKNAERGTFHCLRFVKQTPAFN